MSLLIRTTDTEQVQRYLLLGGEVETSGARTTGRAVLTTLVRFAPLPMRVA